MTVVEWVALRPIFEVCEKETGYKGGGGRRAPWRRQTAADSQLRDTLKHVLEDAREQRRR